MSQKKAYSTRKRKGESTTPPSSNATYQSPTPNPSGNRAERRAAKKKDKKPFNELSPSERREYIKAWANKFCDDNKELLDKLRDN